MGAWKETHTRQTPVTETTNEGSLSYATTSDANEASKSGCGLVVMDT